jgi:hypothetical protein
MLPSKSIYWPVFLGLLLASLALAACQAGGLAVPPALQEMARSLPASAAPVQEEPQDMPAAQPVAAEQPATPPSAVPETAADAETGAAAGALNGEPVALTIPAVNLGAEVTPMGWELTMAGDQVTTRWSVPLDTLGWAVNSAQAGAAGNMVLIGHQAQGSALLRPVALGEVAPGQEILVYSADGATHLYLVSEVSPPIPVVGASPEEAAQAAAYLAPSTDARLTLVSGWPADTTTHRLFVVAQYVSPLQ